MMLHARIMEILERDSKPPLRGYVAYRVNEIRAPYQKTRFLVEV